MSANTCRRCTKRPATPITGNPLTDSVFQLCTPCTNDVRPGPSVEAYRKLLDLYGR